MHIKSKIIVASFFLMSVAFLSGCNTARGFGQDLEQGGKAIQSVAVTQPENKTSSSSESRNHSALNKNSTSSGNSYAIQHDQ